MPNKDIGIRSSENIISCITYEQQKNRINSPHATNFFLHLTYRTLALLVKVAMELKRLPITKIQNSNK